jgi:hypothetical protein
MGCLFNHPILSSDISVYNLFVALIGLLYAILFYSSTFKGCCQSPFSRKKSMVL